HGTAWDPGVCALYRLWWLGTRLVYAVPVLPRPRHGRDRAHGPRADTTTGAGGNDCGSACTPAGDSQCLRACAHPHHVVRSIVGGRWFFPDGQVGGDEPGDRRRGSPVHGAKTSWPPTGKFHIPRKVGNSFLG